jgi:hypothetical protein
MTYVSRQDFAGWIRTTWLPWMAQVPENRRSEFIGAIMDEYLKDYPADADGTIHISMVRLEAEAKKTSVMPVRRSFPAGNFFAALTAAPIGVAIAKNVSHVPGASA